VKRSKRLKEKTTVPVVQAGKVEIDVKQLRQRKLSGCGVFQIPPVEVRSFANLGARGLLSRLVSHFSHRDGKMSCAKPMVYVKSAANGASAKKSE
jgi:hypothetical protein